MKPTFSFIPLLLLILVSCSTYQQVSLSNFTKYGISNDERVNLQYVLKRDNLHYSFTDSRYIINNYEANESEAYESHNVHIDDNIVIPTGACGVCVHSNDDHYVIDFGKGVFVPFMVSSENNRAKDKMVMGERTYALNAGHRNARLYFNSRALKK